MKIYKKVCILSISLILLACFAMPDTKGVDIKMRTEPQIEKVLGEKINFSDGILFEHKEFYNIDLEDINKKIVLNKDKVDVTFYTDPKDNFNKIKANIGFDLYIDDVKQNGEYNLNLNCPVIQDKFVEHQVLHDEKIKDGQKILTYNLWFETLERRVVDQGFYSFSFSPNDVRPLKIEEEDSEKELLRLEHVSAGEEIRRMGILNICQSIDLDLQNLDPNRNVKVEIISLK